MAKVLLAGRSELGFQLTSIVVVEVCDSQNQMVPGLKPCFYCKVSDRMDPAT